MAGKKERERNTWMGFVLGEYEAVSRDELQKRTCFSHYFICVYHIHHATRDYCKLINEFNKKNDQTMKMLQELVIRYSLNSFINLYKLIN